MSPPVYNFDPSEVLLRLPVGNVVLPEDGDWISSRNGETKVRHKKRLKLEITQKLQIKRTLLSYYVFLGLGCVPKLTPAILTNIRGFHPSLLENSGSVTTLIHAPSDNITTSFSHGAGTTRCSNSSKRWTTGKSWFDFPNSQGFSSSSARPQPVC
jgi:hypothetical protein